MRLTEFEFSTQEQIDESNAINSRYLFECHIAELREWRYKKCNELLAQIDSILKVNTF